MVGLDWVIQSPPATLSQSGVWLIEFCIAPQVSALQVLEPTRLIFDF